jgi:Ca-activated chloride channel homolog
MADFSFELDWKAFWVSLIFVISFYVFYLWSRKFPNPKMYYSKTSELEQLQQTFKAKSKLLPKKLQYIALFAALFAFLDPRVYVSKIGTSSGAPSEATEGIAIYFILDQSGSMQESIPISFPGDPDQSMPKIKILKKLTTDFIQGDKALNLSGRPNDMIGLIAFARVPEVLSPLTLEHKAILEKLADLEVVKDKNLDGTGIGYAIYKTAHLIAATRHFAQELADKGKPAYEIQNTIMILVTDGLQESNPLDQGNPLRTMDIPVAAHYAKDQGIRLYIVNLEPKLSTEELAPFRHQMENAAHSTGGEFFFISDSKSLLTIYSDIDRLEKSKLPWKEELAAQAEKKLSKDSLPNLYQRISLYPTLIMISLFALLLSIFLDSTVMRKVP